MELGAPLRFSIRRVPRVEFRRRRFWWILMWALAFLAPASGAWCGEVVIRLGSQLTARDGGWHLGEYVSIQGSRRDAMLAGAVWIHVRGDEIRREELVYLLSPLKGLGVSVRLEMPRRVRVISGAESLEARLARLSRWPWRVEVLGDPSGELELPLGFRDGYPFVYMRDRGQRRKVSLRWHQPVVLARDVMKRGDVVSRERVVLGLGEKRGFEELPSSVDEVLGRRVRTPVRAWAVLRGSWLEGSSGVLGGQTVELVCRVGGVSVSAVGRSVDGGRVGDRVRVMNVQTRAIVTGVVEAPGVVRVEGGDL